MGTSSVEDIVIENVVTLYPNPAQNQITLSFAKTLEEDANFMLINQLGQMIFQRILSKNQTIHSINWKDFPKGIYFYKIENSGIEGKIMICLLYTSPSPRDRQKSRMPSSA